MEFYSLLVGLFLSGGEHFLFFSPPRFNLTFYFFLYSLARNGEGTPCPPPPQKGAALSPSTRIEGHLVLDVGWRFVTHFHSR